MNNNEKYQTLAKFWDQAFLLDDDAKQKLKASLKADSWCELAPSKELFEAVRTLTSQENVLDYGCGSGWGAITFSKLGGQKVHAVDVSHNSIERLKIYLEYYQITNVKAETIAKDWLKDVPDETYDGVICSNVLDVLPLAMSEDLIHHLARVLKPKAKCVIGLNFYITEAMKEAHGFNLTNDELYVDGVLRLLNKSDDEWKKLFSKDFEISSLTYFKWPNETKPTRRLFTLIRK